MDSDGAASFRKGPKAYDQLVGRYSPALGRELIAFAGVRTGQRVLDVGCGTGLLTAELAAVVGADYVCAIDPSEPFVQATRSRVPGSAVEVGGAEEIPFGDGTFDVALAQLVVNFMADPGAGVREMRRVVRPGGTVAACVWDYKGEMTLLRTFWDAARATDRGSGGLDEGVRMGYSDPESLSALWADQQLRSVVTTELRPSVRYADFDRAVGAVPGRRRAHRCLRGDPGRRRTRGAARGVLPPAGQSGRPVRTLGQGLGGGRDSMTRS